MDAGRLRLCRPAAQPGISGQQDTGLDVAGCAPERLSLSALAALCDILEVTPTDLIATRAENVAPCRTAASGGADVVDLASAIRPKRARFTPDS
ncbi:helix-turn-helix domain-containing protein [Streptomyces tendae]|uniref:helix-turn-helix domain-containing protein n=1 Tax=Streptomyces tendae TaxID=1932 RepID=UPI00368304C6